MDVNCKITRNYFFQQREVHEALIEYARSKGIICPQYVANTSDTTWTTEEDGIRVEWVTEDDAV